jgi:hypothetical protein
VYCEEKFKLRSHNTSYCLIEVVTKGRFDYKLFINVPLLQTRRQHQRLIFLYKVVEGQIPAIPPHEYISHQKPKRHIRARTFHDCETTNIVNSPSSPLNSSVVFAILHVASSPLNSSVVFAILHVASSPLNSSVVFK